MADARLAVLASGYLLLGLGAFMLAPMVLELADRSGAWRAFAWSALACVFIGGAAAVGLRGAKRALSVRGAFLLTVSTWLALVTFAALPFVLMPEPLSPTDAFFESMSGLTTTGATVMTGLNDTARGILLWRAILQWIGGIGIVVTAIALLPLLQIGGMQLFRLESSDASDKILPRAPQIAALIALIYLTLTFACALAYAAVGMSVFDAVAHAMTTIATGGFSTRDESLGAFLHLGADWVAVGFMLAGALPFGLYMLIVRGQWRQAGRDPQTLAFLPFVLVVIAIVALGLIVTGLYDTTGAVRMSAFNTVAVLTGTGYATADFGDWGGAATAFFFCLMFVGGCAGSTACGVKIFRFQIAALAFSAYVAKVARPNAIAPLVYNGRHVNSATIYSVLSFIFLFLATVTATAVVLGLIGLDPITALSGAATAVANVGPGLGQTIGPASTFQCLPDAAKWTLSFAMLFGRLEIVPLLVLMNPGFWRN